jgi:hypothetical protein
VAIYYKDNDMTIPEATGLIALLITLISMVGGGAAFFFNRNNTHVSENWKVS